MRAIAPLALLLAFLAPSLPARAVEDAVTQANLLASERYWPYHVVLVDPWQPSSLEKPLAEGTRGVLVRLERSGLARIDFGSDGVHEVPVPKTDLVQSANRIRRGEITKLFPNFSLAIGARMVDPVEMKIPGPAALADVRTFLCVFADPSAEGFAELTRALTSLPERPGASTVLFSQGAQTNPKLGERLRSLGWNGSFVLVSVSQAYTRSLIPDATPRPFLQLVTNEGRVLFESGWDPASASTPMAELDAALAAVSTARASNSPR